MKPLTYDIHPCQDEVLKCQWMKLEELAVSPETTPLTHRLAEVILKMRSKGNGFNFERVDIGMEEWPMNFPMFALNKTYKLFLRTPPDATK